MILVKSQYCTRPLLISKVQRGQFIPGLLRRGYACSIYQRMGKSYEEINHKPTERLRLTPTSSAKLARVKAPLCLHKSQGQSTPTSLLAPDG